MYIHTHTRTIYTYTRMDVYTGVTQGHRHVEGLGIDKPAAATLLHGALHCTQHLYMHVCVCVSIYVYYIYIYIPTGINKLVYYHTVLPVTPLLHR